MSERYVVHVQGFHGFVSHIVELEPFEAKVVERVFESTNLKSAADYQPEAYIYLESQAPDWIIARCQ